MNSKRPKCNLPGWVWIELNGFMSEDQREQCLQLLKEGYAHPFKPFLLKVSYRKIWFRAPEAIASGAAWLNGAVPNHCTRLLWWLKESKRQDDAFRKALGWPTGERRGATDSPEPRLWGRVHDSSALPLTPQHASNLH